MSGIKILLLPGLDGDGFYLTALQELLSAEFDCERIAYPHQRMTYEDLCAWVSERLDTASDYVIVAESFGGPLGILLAEVLEEQAKALVLCATFCRPPLPRFLLTLAATLYPQFIPFDWMAHLLNFFVFNGQNPGMARKLHRMLKEKPSDVIAHRMRILCDLDMRPVSAALALPCLVIKASHDRIVWSSRFRHLSDAWFVSVKGPHGLAGTRPKAVAEAISGFIKVKI